MPSTSSCSTDRREGQGLGSTHASRPTPHACYLESPPAARPMADFMKILQQVKDMQGRFETIQKELESKTVTGSAGGGMVTVEADGKGTVRRVKLDPSVVNP